MVIAGYAKEGNKNYNISFCCIDGDPFQKNVSLAGVRLAEKSSLSEFFILLFYAVAIRFEKFKTGHRRVEIEEQGKVSVQKLEGG